MEKNLLVIILIILLIIAVVMIIRYTLLPLLKSSAFSSDKGSSLETNKTKTEYKRMIDSSKEDYKAMMQQYKDNMKYKSY